MFPTWVRSQLLLRPEWKKFITSHCDVRGQTGVYSQADKVPCGVNHGQADRRCASHAGRKSSLHLVDHGRADRWTGLRGRRRVAVYAQVSLGSDPADLECVLPVCRRGNGQRTESSVKRRSSSVQTRVRSILRRFNSAQTASNSSHASRLTQSPSAVPPKRRSARLAFPAISISSSSAMPRMQSRIAAITNFLPLTQTAEGRELLRPDLLRQD